MDRPSPSPPAPRAPGANANAPDSTPGTTASTTTATRPRRFRGSRASASATSTTTPTTTTTSITTTTTSTQPPPPPPAVDPTVDSRLAEALRTSPLPANYNFEIPKTIARVRKTNARRVALQMPEGLLAFACPIADLITAFAGHDVDVVVMADVTYGACCVDDFSAAALGVQLLVHYGHSCLVPVDVTRKECGVDVMYVFVDILFDATHAAECIKLEFPDPSTRIALMGTIQFTGGAMHQAKRLLQQAGYTSISVPQEKPLSGGEVLGCTSPSLPSAHLDALVFVADGRFHLESAMIANPDLPAYRYDPYSKILSRESYDHATLLATRWASIQAARTATRWGVVLGTLGRQGNTAVLDRVRQKLVERGLPNHVVVLLSELSPAKLALMQSDPETGIQAWIQIACPRLSVDWARAFTKPLLTPYEAYVALGFTEWRAVYPQDFYSKSGGPWSNYYTAAPSSTAAAAAAMEE